MILLYKVGSTNNSLFQANSLTLIDIGVVKEQASCILVLISKFEAYFARDK